MTSCSPLLATLLALAGCDAAEPGGGDVAADTDGGTTDGGTTDGGTTDGGTTDGGTTDGGTTDGGTTDGGTTDGGTTDGGTTDGGEDSAADTGGAEISACGQPVRLEDAGHWLQEDLYGDAELAELPNEQGPGVVLGDLDGDGWLDAVLAVGAEHSITFRNDGAGVLEVTEAFTVDGERFPSARSIAAGDIDGDGDLDLVLSRARGLDDLLLFNEGDGTFIGRPLQDSQGESVTPTLLDLDNDGDLDLFIAGFTQWLDPYEVQVGNQVGDGLKLYRWTGDAFVDATDLLDPDSLPALTYHGNVIDFDLDGDLDLYLGNDYGRYVVTSNMYANDGGRFSQAGCACDLPGTIMGVAPGDPNGDGLPDLYITDWDRNFLLTNLGDGSFLNTALSTGADPESPDAVVGWASSFVDIDGDGDQDLATTYGPVIVNEDGVGGGGVPAEQPDALLINDGEGNFTDASAALGFQDLGIGRSIAVGDLDRDGKPDLVVGGRVFMRAYYSRGGCPAGLSLSLDDGAGNRSGLGAHVVATVGERSQHYWLTPSTSFGSSAPELYIGLGGAAAADSLHVTWPDGATATLSDVAAGRITVTPD